MDDMLTLKNATIDYNKHYYLTYLIMYGKDSFERLRSS